MNSTLENDSEIIRDSTSSYFIVLEDMDLWKKFNSVINEMIITKSGRCLFPILKFKPFNLEPKSQYSFAIDIIQASPYKYKYRDKKWVSGGVKILAPPTQKREYYHPDSPQTGHFWMTHGISFSKIKLTNHIKNLSDGPHSTKKKALLEKFKEDNHINNNDVHDNQNRKVTTERKDYSSKRKSSKFNIINSISKLPENHFYLSSFFISNSSSSKYSLINTKDKKLLHKLSRKRELLLKKKYKSKEGEKKKSSLSNLNLIENFINHSGHSKLNGEEKSDKSLDHYHLYSSKEFESGATSIYINPNNKNNNNFNNFYINTMDEDEKELKNQT
ncbi:T-box-domain-containing protein, partial [Neocallimastix sp. 'constans']